jgi:hypothetical protein
MYLKVVRDMSDDYHDTFAAGDHGSPADDMAEAAAMFLGNVLGLEDDTASLAQDLSAIKRDVNASIYTIQLESSVGPAAFLVYGYLLDERGGDGHTGKELFDSGRVTLQQAAERNSPGPRAVAHGESGDYGFIIATTPGTFRALAGESSESVRNLEPAPADLPSTPEIDRIRRDAAIELLQLLRDANERSSQWLGAIQTASQSDAANDNLLAFNESETELALFLLDDRSIGDLLRTLNLLIATAQQHTASALRDDAD